MSYAALRNFYIFSTLAQSFGPKGGGYLKAYFLFSKSMYLVCLNVWGQLSFEEPKYSFLLNREEMQNKKLDVSIPLLTMLVFLFL